MAGCQDLVNAVEAVNNTLGEISDILQGIKGNTDEMKDDIKHLKSDFCKAASVGDNTAGIVESLDQRLPARGYWTGLGGDLITAVNGVGDVVAARLDQIAYQFTAIQCPTTGVADVDAPDSNLDLDTIHEPIDHSSCDEGEGEGGNGGGDNGGGGGVG